MGIHRHVRVVINGEKNHSSGGDARNWILKKLKAEGCRYDWRSDNGFNDNNHVPNDDVETIRYIFIKRHRHHAHRTVEGIIELKCFKGHVMSFTSISNPFIKYVTIKGVEIPNVFDYRDKSYMEGINAIGIEEIIRLKRVAIKDSVKMRAIAVRKLME